MSRRCSRPFSADRSLIRVSNSFSLGSLVSGVFKIGVFPSCTLMSVRERVKLTCTPPLLPTSTVLVTGSYLHREEKAQGDVRGSRPHTTNHPRFLTRRLCGTATAPSKSTKHKKKSRNISKGHGNGRRTGSSSGPNMVLSCFWLRCCRVTWHGRLAGQHVRLL